MSTLNLFAAGSAALSPDAPTAADVLLAAVSSAPVPEEVEALSP